MKLGWTIIYVANVAQTVAFYERCFGLSHRGGEVGEQFCEMETGETRLAFSHEGLIDTFIPRYRRNRPADDPAGFEIALVTEDVAGAYRKALAGGAVSVLEPAQKAWGQTVAYVRDLNGVLVELASPMD